MKFFLETEISF